MLEGFVGCAVEFELEDVDKVVGLNDAVGASLAQLLLCVDHVHAYQPQDEVERELEVTLPFTFVLLASDGVWDTGKEGGEALAELLKVAVVKQAHTVENP